MKHSKNINIETKSIPDYVTHVTKVLQNAGFEAFLVGGCVRDLLTKKSIKDWDLTTNANPGQIQSLFKKTVYENSFGTVAVCLPKDDYNASQGEEYYIIEVTPYRLEGEYTDFRHPDNVSFTRNIDDDLSRRDFTVNSMAYDQLNDIFIDNFGGIKDIKDKIIRCVGEPDQRFREDALRMLRAIRFSCSLDFAIDSQALDSIFKNSDLIKFVSKERIRDEFIKIIESPKPAQGLAMLQKLGLLKHFIPELEEGIGCHQGGAHIYDVFEHLLGALQHSADKGYTTNVRLSALFHDIGKPRTKREPKGKSKPTFYGHEVVGANMTRKILERLNVSRETVSYVTNMVRRHMFFSDTEKITLSAVRRVVSNVGTDHIWELMQVRECDRVGMKKVEAPYRLRKYHAMIEQVLRDPISVSQLKIDGNYMIKELHVKPGPRMGWMLHALLEEVLEDPDKNTIEYLTKMVTEYAKMPDSELKNLGEKGKQAKNEAENEELADLNKKHNIK